jgi:enterochelin esterase-like enzyme
MPCEGKVGLGRLLPQTRRVPLDFLKKNNLRLHSVEKLRLRVGSLIWDHPRAPHFPVMKKILNLPAFAARLISGARSSFQVCRFGIQTGPRHSLPPGTPRGRFTGWMSVMILLAFVDVAATTSVNGGQVLAYNFHSQTLGRDWRYNVYLPDGYDHSNLRYPVLFMLHGYSENENAWVTKGHINVAADHLIAAGEIPPVVIIMPGSGDNWYLDLKEKIETAFIQDLVPEVEHTFRIAPDREGRAIGGDSMGGYGALRFILKYPEQFGSALLMSPAIYVPDPPLTSSARKGTVFGSPFDAEIWQRANYPTLLDGFFAKNLPIALYINAGDHDDFEIETQIGPVYKMMREHKFPVAMRVTAGVHDFAVWRAELPDALRFICGEMRAPDLMPAAK